MDPVIALAAIPGIGPYVPYITAAIALASVLAPALKAPEPGGNGIYAAFYSFVNALAINFGHARNATAPVQVPPDTLVPVVVTPEVTVEATVSEPKS